MPRIPRSDVSGRAPANPNSFGSTIPAPPTSIQPECRQTGQPAPSHTWQDTYASIEGSVKGK